MSDESKAKGNAYELIARYWCSDSACCEKTAGNHFNPVCHINQHFQSSGMLLLDAARGPVIAGV